MFRKLALTIAAAAVLLVGSIGMAQQTDNPALRALISFLTLVDPGLLEGLDSVEFMTEEELEVLAEQLLATLEANGIIDNTTANQMRGAVASRVLPRDTLIVFLADVSNGTEVLTDEERSNPAALEESVKARAPTLDIPRGDSQGNLDVVEVAQVVTAVAMAQDGILNVIADSYRDPITPLNATEGAG